MLFIFDIRTQGVFRGYFSVKTAS